jgi:hypothetical protein
MTTNVTVSNVLINGSPLSFSYSVRVFDPDPPPPGFTFSFPSPSATVGSTGGSGFAPLQVTPAGTVSWTASSSAAG